MLVYGSTVPKLYCRSIGPVVPVPWYRVSWTLENVALVMSGFITSVQPACAAVIVTVNGAAFLNEICPFLG